MSNFSSAKELETCSIKPETPKSEKKNIEGHILIQGAGIFETQEEGN